MGIALQGQVYSKTEATASDAARRFETSEKFLTYAYISVTTHTLLFGDSSNQYYSRAAGESFVLENVDISTLYFKNAGAGSNGVASIVGILATY